MEEVLRWGWLATAAAVYRVGLRHLSRDRHPRGPARPRLRGARGPRRRRQRARPGRRAGRRLREAALLIAEADAVTEATGTRVAPYGALVLAGLPRPGGRGLRADRGHHREATAGGQGTAVQYAHWANAVVMNGLGRYDEALAAAIEASDDTPELFVSMWSLSELVEAASRTGNTELAAAASRG